MKLDEIQREVTVIDRPPVLKPNHEDKTAKPPMYAVVLHNDEFTHAMFVVDMLEKVFQKNLHDAMSLMMIVHKFNKAPIGVYPKDVAESKAAQGEAMARAGEHPLKLTVEPI
jgi:ATP-dependent Clp protease adaptor protein ClpS